MVDPRETKRAGSASKAGGLTSDLAERIRRAREAKTVGQNSSEGNLEKDMSGMSRGLRLGSEFVAAVLVGAGIGFLLDQWLGTTPWLSLVMMMFGFVAGVLNVVRAAEQMNKAASLPTGADTAPGDIDK
jgi:ATP synthase protein I